MPNYPSSRLVAPTPLLIIGHRSSYTRDHKKPALSVAGPLAGCSSNLFQQQCGKVVEAADRTLCDRPGALRCIPIIVTLFLGVAPRCLYSASNCRLARC